MSDPAEARRYRAGSTPTGREVERSMTDLLSTVRAGGPGPNWSWLNLSVDRAPVDLGDADRTNPDRLGE